MLARNSVLWGCQPGRPEQSDAEKSRPTSSCGPLDALDEQCTHDTNETEGHVEMEKIILVERDNAVESSYVHPGWRAKSHSAESAIVQRSSCS